MPRTTLQEDFVGHLEGVHHAGLIIGDGSRRSLGMTIRVSTFSLRIWIHRIACTARRRPSKVEGRVTTPMVSAPRSWRFGHYRCGSGAGSSPLARVMNTMSAAWSAFRCRPDALRPLTTYFRIAPRTESRASTADRGPASGRRRHEQWPGHRVGRDDSTLRSPELCNFYSGKSVIQVGSETLRFY